MVRLLIALLLCAGCTPEALESMHRTYTTPDTYKTCWLDECPEIPFPSLIMVTPDETLYTPVKTPIDEVFVTCLGADTTVIPEGAMRVTFESTEGVTKRTYDPRFYDWVPVMPGIGFVGLTNISSVEIDCSVTYSTTN